jgi:dihydroorotate dehydrogenase (fumarate)
MKMDLATTYLGLRLRTPLVVSASPLSDDLGLVRRLVEAGISAVVMRSWFTDSGGERRDPVFRSLDQYLDHIRHIRKGANIPVVASLNGTGPDDWASPARRIEEAGADALELNIYYVPVDLDLPAERIEQDHLDVVASVRAAVSIPVAVKLSPSYTNVCNIAGRFAGAGANALVLFNRFYQPDIELESRRTVSHLLLSTEQDLRLPLRWIGLLHGRIGAELAASGGIRTGNDVLKLMAVGAQVAMLCSAVMDGGVGRVRAVLEELETWMEACGFESVDGMRGIMSAASLENPSAFERAQYVRMIGEGMARPKRGR